MWSEPTTLPIFVYRSKGHYTKPGGSAVPRPYARWTVMLIPQTDKRPVTFQLPTAVPKVALLLLITAVVAVVVLGRSYQALQVRVAELIHLETINAQQRQEIEVMTSKARETDEALVRLRALEQEVLALLEQGTKANKASQRPGPVNQQVATGGQGGEIATAYTEGLPVLSNMLPADVKAVLYARPRPTSEVASRGLNERRNAVGGSLDQAVATAKLIDAQHQETTLHEKALQDSKQALLNHLHYLSHRPSGFPVSNGEVTSNFGMRWSPFGWGRQMHNGIDIGAPYYTPIVSTADGVVAYAGWKESYGWTVIIDHGYGFRTLYAHMVDYDVTSAQSVKRGQVIGYVGSSGSSTGAHVHYEVHLHNVPQDPMQYAR